MYNNNNKVNDCTPRNIPIYRGVCTRIVVPYACVWVCVYARVQYHRFFHNTYIEIPIMMTGAVHFWLFSDITYIRHGFPSHAPPLSRKPIIRRIRSSRCGEYNGFRLFHRLLSILPEIIYPPVLHVHDKIFGLVKLWRWVHDGFSRSAVPQII